MSDLHIIWNPVAGNGRSLKAYAAVCGALDAEGIPFTSARSAYAGHAVELAKKALADGAERIAVLGGDGTVREVATVLCGTDAVMGIVPCGTGNDIVRPLGIPIDPVEALRVILADKRRRMDTAMANDEMYFNVAGFGFDVDVLDYTELFKKRCRNGSVAYLRGLLAAMKGLQNRRTVVTWPEGRLETNALIVAAGNGTHFGGGMKVTPNADPFDGKLDICIIHDVKRSMLFTVLPKFMKGAHLSLPNVKYFRASELTAVCEPISRIEVDGDVLPGTPVTFRIGEKKLWVITPDPIVPR